MRHRLFAILIFVAGCAQNYYTSDAGLESMGAFHEELDFRNLDYAKLNAACFHATNEARRQNGSAPVGH